VHSKRASSHFGVNRSLRSSGPESFKVVVKASAGGRGGRGKGGEGCIGPFRHLYGYGKSLHTVWRLATV
jgi:hypothetical protein